MEFFRARLTDPRSRAETTETDTFSGTGAAQTLTLTPANASNEAQCITDVAVGGTSILKWQDYTIDIQNQQVSGTFTSGTANVIVTYKRGATNWIYTNLAKESLSSTSYPRINIRIISNPGKRLGNYTAPIDETIHFQVDIWVKENYIYDDGTNKWSEGGLAMYLARQMVKAFEDYVNDLYPKLHDFELINILDADWEVDREAFHVIFEFQMSGDSIAG